MAVKLNLADLAAAASKRGVPELDTHELVQWQQTRHPLLILDVREQAERAGGFIPNSVHLPRGILERDIYKTAFDGVVTDEHLQRSVVCYCGGGHRSLLAAESLRLMGFTNVTSLRGGFAAWRRDGHPTAT